MRFDEVLLAVLVTLGDFRVRSSTGGVLRVGGSARSIFRVGSGTRGVVRAAIALAVVTSVRTGRTRCEVFTGILVTLGKSGVRTNAGVLGVRSKAGTAMVGAVVTGGGGSGAGDEVVVGVFVPLADMVHGQVVRLVLGLKVRPDDPVSIVVLGALGEAGVAASA